MNNFFKRTLTGAIFVLSILVSIYFQVPYYTLSALFSVFCVLGLYEFYKLVNLNENIQVPSIALIIAGIILYAGCIQMAFWGTATLIIAYAFYILALVIAELYRNKPAPMHNLAFSLLGQCMVALPFSMLNLIAKEDNFHWILALFILIWVSDTGAYLTGMTLGKHKFFERISPKKTWEGFIGGALFSIAGSLVFWYFFPNVPVWQWILFVDGIPTLAIYTLTGENREARAVTGERFLVRRQTGVVYAAELRGTSGYGADTGGIPCSDI